MLMLRWSFSSAKESDRKKDKEENFTSSVQEHLRCEGTGMLPFLMSNNYVGHVEFWSLCFCFLFVFLAQPILSHKASKAEAWFKHL